METAITTHPDWTTGDLELISSDSVRFCVESRYVVAASDVLGGMIESLPADPEPIEFTDPDIETASSIAIFLALATATFRSTFRDTEAFVAAIGFLHKWGCRTPTAALVGHVALGGLSGLLPTRVFVLGALLDSRELTLAALHRFCESFPDITFVDRFPVPDKYKLALVFAHRVFMNPPTNGDSARGYYARRAFVEMLEESGVYGAY